MTHTSHQDEWLELAVLAEPEAVESLSEAFTRWGQGVAIEQPIQSSRDGDVVEIAADAPLVLKTYLPLEDPEAGRRRAEIEKAVWALGQLRQVGPLEARSIREEDWANAWKEHFYVHRVGESTVIVPSWRHDEYEPRLGDVVLLLDPGMAFGTGLHPTTRLCLLELERLMAPGLHALDLGAGSGILAIAAARRGAAHVDAVEVDPVAAAVCRENVERNKVDGNVAVHAATLESSGLDGPYDLAVANITIRVLLEVYPELARRLRPSAPVIFSGVLEERAVDLVVRLELEGWRHERTVQEQDWVAITMRVPAA